MIAYCPNCKPHEFQDERYGAGNRVFNPVTEKGKIVGGRCTVCSPPKEPTKKRGGVVPLDQLKRR